MLGITHLTIGALSTCLVLQTAAPTTIAIGAIASLLPDVDTSVSPAGRALPWLSCWLERQMPHRSCTHSVFASFVVALATYPLALWLKLPLNPIHAVNIGYFVGWYADSFTKTGVEMFWPDPSRWVIPRNRKYRLATGSRAEWTVLLILVPLTLLVFQMNYSGGIEHAFNRMLATSTGVLEVYNKVGGSHLVTVHIKGVRQSNRAPILGDYLLIEPHGKQFIVQSQTGELYQAGTSETDCQILVEQITADPGAAATIDVESVTLELDSLGSKLDKFNRLHAMVFVTGELSIDNADALSHVVGNPYEFRSIKADVGKVVFDTAPLQQVIRQLGNELGTGNLFIRSIYVQS